MFMYSEVIRSETPGPPNDAVISTGQENERISSLDIAVRQRTSLWEAGQFRRLLRPCLASARRGLLWLALPGQALWVGVVVRGLVSPFPALPRPAAPCLALPRRALPWPARLSLVVLVG